MLIPEFLKHTMAFQKNNKEFHKELWKRSVLGITPTQETRKESNMNKGTNQNYIYDAEAKMDIGRACGQKIR